MQDRIKQMAVEAGFGAGHAEAAGALLERFAQAVARECAKMADDSDFGPVPHHIGDAIRDRFGIEGE